MSTTTAAPTEFGSRIARLVADLPPSGVIDRFAANDILLDLLDGAPDPAAAAAVLSALVALPKSSLVDRRELNRLIAGLAPSD